MTPFNYVAAAAFVPLCIAGAPLRAHGELFRNQWHQQGGLARPEALEMSIASRTCAARAAQEQPED